MANSQAIATSFKGEILKGIHALGTSVVRAGTGADTIKAALFLASASIGAATATYSTTGEVTGTNYTAGGVTVTNATVPATPLVTTDMGTFAANEYAKYTFQLGDLTEAGDYTVRLTYTDASKRLISDVASFTVNT